MSSSWLLSLGIVAIVLLPLDNGLFINDNAGPIVSIPGLGEAVGTSTPESLSFFGLPFGVTGRRKLRFKDPLPPQPWKPLVRDATKPRAGCMQSCEVPWFACPESYSEECLHLNVHVPLRRSSSDPLPVAVFYHGGHFQTGSGGALLYDPTFGVNRTEIIFVTVNYRLGLLGHMHCSGTDIQGDYGLKDSLAALRWIKQYIHVFGGDPNQVTVMGQSAGASTIAAMLISPAAMDNGQPLFHRAIMLSKPVGLRFPSKKWADVICDKSSEVVGCAGYTGDAFRKCWEVASEPSILEASKKANSHVDPNNLWKSFYSLTPIGGGALVPGQFMTEMAKGNGLKNVPLMIGDVEHEGHLFVYQVIKEKLNWIGYWAMLFSFFGSDAVQIVSHYDYDGVEDYRPVLGEVASDYLFYCPFRKLFRQLEGKNPIYSYRFNHITSFDGWGPKMSYCRYKCCHGGDLPFAFAAYDLHPEEFPFSEAEKTLANRYAGAFANFIKTGDPNRGFNTGLPDWPLFTSSGNQQMEIKAPNGEVRNVHPRDKACDMYDKIGYYPEKFIDSMESLES